VTPALEVGPRTPEALHRVARTEGHPPGTEVGSAAVEHGGEGDHDPADGRRRRRTGGGGHRAVGGRRAVAPAGGRQLQDGRLGTGHARPDVGLGGVHPPVAVQDSHVLQQTAGSALAVIGRVARRSPGRAVEVDRPAGLGGPDTEVAVGGFQHPASVAAHGLAVQAQGTGHSGGTGGIEVRREDVPGQGLAAQVGQVPVHLELQTPPASGHRTSGVRCRRHGHGGHLPLTGGTAGVRQQGQGVGAPAAAGPGQGQATGQEAQDGQRGQGSAHPAGGRHSRFDHGASSSVGCLDVTPARPVPAFVSLGANLAAQGAGSRPGPERPGVSVTACASNKPAGGRSAEG
jgi:hypothetical protein